MRTGSPTLCTTAPGGGRGSPPLCTIAKEGGTVSPPLCPIALGKGTVFPPLLQLGTGWRERFPTPDLINTGRRDRFPSPELIGTGRRDRVSSPVHYCTGRRDRCPSDMHVNIGQSDWGPLPCLLQQWAEGLRSAPLCTIAHHRGIGSHPCEPLLRAERLPPPPPPVRRSTGRRERFPSPEQISSMRRDECERSHGTRVGVEGVAARAGQVGQGIQNRRVVCCCWWMRHEHSIWGMGEGNIHLCGARLYCH